MLTDIRLQNFRSYNDESFEFNKSVNIIVGPNASGKTNLLESIILIAGENSYRGKDIELINYDSEWSKIESHTTDNQTRIIKLEKNGESVIKSYEIGGQKFKRLSINRTIPVVIFEPENLTILSSSPDSRRNFLDDLLEKIKPGFKETRKHYKRVLYQRNTLLKNNHSNARSNIFVWNLRLSELAEAIVRYRLELIDVMNKSSEGIYSELSNIKSKVQFNYSTKINTKNYASDLLNKLENNIDTDFERGFTSSGPHRDDFDLLLNGHLASETASRGEMRTLMLVCKVLETRIVEKYRDKKPILLFDDVFSELDGNRRKNLTNFLSPYQTFITTTDADVILHHFSEQANIILTDKKM